MRHTVIWVLAVILVLSSAGCAELKQLRVETAEQKSTIEQLNKDKQACQDALKNSQQQLEQYESQLRAKESELQKKEVKVKEQSDAFTRMQEAMKKELESRQVAIKELEGKLTLAMVESILVDSGKADVKKEGIETLSKVADVLKNTKDQEIIVAGYTDNVPIIGKLAKAYPSNWELSAARAISVVKILVDDGVDPKLLSASGFSEYRPAADNDTPEGRAKNRRMEIILMPTRK